MKLTSFLLLVTLMQVTASVYSQNTLLSLSMKNSTLKDVFREIENQSEFTFLYNNAKIDVSKEVDVEFQSTKIEDILNQVLNGTGIAFMVIDKQVVLAGKDQLKAAAEEAQQQGRKITGNVTDPTGAPIPGTAVVVKGTTEGVTTNMDGSFSLVLPANAKILVVSFVGMKAQEIVIGNQSTFNVVLTEETIGIEEVVAIGYGVQKKKLVTGATVSVKGEDLQKLSTTNALQAMQGQTAGVNITSTSGQPGGGFKINIRGLGTVGNSGPLFVVDGVNVNDITYLNNSDIASVDVLKDAASCAIYGINGANGVVLITTKGGQSAGKQSGQISFDAYYGIQNAARKVDLLNAQQYATMQNEGAVNSGKAPYFTQNQITALGTGTNWLDQMFSNNVPTQNYNLAANGGSATSTYSLGLSYTQQGGIIGGTKLSNYERYNFRSNTEHKLYGDVLKIGQHLTFSYKNQSGISDGGQYSNSVRSALSTTPLLAMYDATGNFLNSQKETMYNGGPWYDSEANPYAIMQYTNQNNSKSQTLIGDVYAELQPIKNLRIKSTFGLNYYSSAYHSYSPAYTNLSLYAYNQYETINQNSSQNYTWNWDNTINYTFNIKDHKFDVLGGSSIRKFQGSYLNGSNTGATLFGTFDRAYLSNSQITGYPQSNPTIVPPKGATETDLAYYQRLASAGQVLTHAIGTGGNANAVYSQASFFGRINYNYKETYLATVVFRADGSTHFAPGQQWGYFPSISGGWVASNEPFMESTKNWLSFLKVRASLGSNGNDAIRDFNYLSIIQLSNAQYNFGNDNSTLTTGSYPSTIGVEKTKWETSYQTNIGIDARFLHGKLDLSIDLYNKKTKDWLIAAPLLATSGVSINPYINGGDVTNKGIELQATYNNQIGNDFNFSITGSYAYNQNVVNNIPTADGIIHGGTNSLYNNSPEFFRASAGQPIGYFWGYKTAGIFQTEVEVQSNKSNGNVLQPNAKPGDVKFVDLNGDGKITSDDKTNIGNPNPPHVFGLSFKCNYKNFDLSVTTNGVAGNKIVQSYRNISSHYGNWTNAILGRWHGEGTSNTIPRITEDNANWAEFSDLYIHDGSYLRISNITLGYDFAKAIKFKNLSQFRLYVATENLFTFTKYDGLDPEVGHSESDAAGVYSFGQGVDIGTYPRPQTFLVGVSIKF